MAYKYRVLNNATSYTPAAQVPYAFGYQRQIRYIVIHHWGVDGQAHDGVVSFFAKGPGTSAHYVASAGRVDQIVDPANAAWHAGHSMLNAQSIGIECRPEMSAGDLETVCELIADLEKRFGTLQLTYHQAWYATACPGRYMYQMGYIRSRVNQIKAGSARQSAPAQSLVEWIVSNADTVRQIIREELNNTKYGALSNRSIVATLGEMDKNQWSTLKRVSHLFNLYRIGIPKKISDGALGPAIRRALGYDEAVQGKERSGQDDRDSAGLYRGIGE